MPSSSVTVVARVTVLYPHHAIGDCEVRASDGSVIEFFPVADAKNAQGAEKKEVVKWYLKPYQEEKLCVVVGPTPSAISIERCNLYQCENDDPSYSLTTVIVSFPSRKALLEGCKTFLRCAEDILLADEACRQYLSSSFPSNPMTRWWWLGKPITKAAVSRQLQWVKEHEFSGVECAFMDLSQGRSDNAAFGWLSADMHELLRYAEEEAKGNGLCCDFTFGSCWPFGGPGVAPATASKAWDGEGFEFTGQTIKAHWDALHLRQQNPLMVLNHLNAGALEAYFNHLIPTFDVVGTDATTGEAGSPNRRRTGLFCDSLELHTAGIFDETLLEEYSARYGMDYDRATVQRREHAATPAGNVDLMYNYRSLRADAMTRNFYANFTKLCEASEHNALSRVQCHGSPTDLLKSFGACSVPESESILFEPHFSLIPSSAAALSGRKIVSCETFTCLYGFPHPSPYMMNCLAAHRKEQVADMKLLFDVLVTRGINHIVWHGMPFNDIPSGEHTDEKGEKTTVGLNPGDKKEFYASVHVGPDAYFVRHLKAFNRYMGQVCRNMRHGRVLAQVAVWLPNDDVWGKEGYLPDKQRTPGAQFHWEHRHTTPPAHLMGYAPMFVSRDFLACAVVDPSSHSFSIGEATFSALYVGGTGYGPGMKLSETSANILSHFVEQGGRVVLDDSLICNMEEDKEEGKPTPACSQCNTAPTASEIASIGTVRDQEKYTQCLQSILRGHCCLKCAIPEGPLVQFPSTVDAHQTTWFAARVNEDDEDTRTLTLFFCRPEATRLTYPVALGQSKQAESPLQLPVRVNWGPGPTQDIQLQFGPFGSVTMDIVLDKKTADVKVVDRSEQEGDLQFVPPEPETL